MFPSNKVTVLLVVICIVVSHGPLVIGMRFPITREKKDKILAECDRFIRIGYPIHVVSHNSPCCEAVRTVENRDMFWVIAVLTIEDKAKYSEEKIEALNRLCQLPTHPPHGPIMGPPRELM